MAHEEATGKTPEELADRTWDLAKSIGTAMLTTYDGERPRSRPMAATVRREEHAIYFLTDAAAPKIDLIADYPLVSLSFADTGGNTYVTITGRAVVSNDRGKIKDIWTPMTKAWWDSAEDPAIRLITVSPTDGELWDGPNRLIAAAIMLTAAATGAKLQVGEHAKVSL